MILQIFCLCLAQSQENSTNYFGSGFDSALLNTTSNNTQVSMTTELNTTINTGTICFNTPTLNYIITTFNLKKH